MKTAQCNRVWKEKEIKNSGDYFLQRTYIPQNDSMNVVIKGKCSKCGQMFLINGNQNETGLQCFNKDCEQKYMIEDCTLYSVERDINATEEEKRESASTEAAKLEISK